MKPVFPWRKHSKTELLNEYKTLRYRLDAPCTHRKLDFSKVGYKCTNYFFQKVRMKTRAQSKISAYDYWQKNHKKIIKWNSNYRHDLFRGVSFLSHPPAHFPIYIAGYIMCMFGATSVLDPYAGWGDRCLAAMSLDINYTGIDSNPRLRKPYQNMISFYKPYTRSKIKMYFGKSEEISLPKIDFDFILTSPPFWDENKHNLLEEYTGSETDYTKFMRTSLVPIVKKYLRKNIWVCIYIPVNMYRDLADKVGVAKKKITFTTPSNNLKKNGHGKPSKNTIYCFHK